MEDKKIENSEKIQEIVDRRIEERKEEIKKEAREEFREELESHVGEKESEKTDQDQDISRRNFLKKIGMGAAGIGAIGLAPAASQLKLTKNGIFSSTGIDLSSSTTVDGNLDLGAHNITNTDQVKSNTANITELNTDNITNTNQIKSNSADITEVKTDKLTGNISGKTDGITHISGNVYVQDTQPSMDENDIWIDTS